VVALALHAPFGIAGIVLGTVIGTIVMCVSQGAVLHRDLGGIEAHRTVSEAVKMLVGAALLAAACYGAWHVLDAALGRSFGAQLLSVSAGIGAGVLAYAAAVWVLGVQEARQLRALLPGRLGG
jgi:putative peptidoglycan lipid II flippase